MWITVDNVDKLGIRKRDFHVRLLFPQRIRIVLLLIILLSPLLLLAGALEELAGEGDRAYREGKFDEAIQAYREVLQGGHISGAVLYNLGNAYYKQGRIGLAILFYERALREMPHNRDIRYNLNLTRQRTVDRIESPPRLPFWSWLDSLRDLVSPSALAWSAWGTSMLAAILFGAYLLVRRNLYRKFLRSTTIVIVVIFCLELGLLTLRFVHDHRPPNAIIMAEKVVVYSAPDTGSREVFHLHEGTRVTVLKELEGFREVALEDGRQGWIPGNVCEFI